MGIPEVISIAFVMGLAGSLHCIGMCGPIAFSLAPAGKSRGERLQASLLYNTGRIVSYTWLGLVAGLAGKVIVAPGLQQFVSIGLSLVMVIYLIFQYRGVKAGSSFPFQNLFLQLRGLLSRLLNVRSRSSYLGIGLLNGLLPCGTIYLALASSFLTGTSLKGSLFMAAFGFGTFPAMFATVFFGSLLSYELRLKIRRGVPFILGLTAALLLLRGLNLGIPYLSPLVTNETESPSVICH